MERPASWQNPGMTIELVPLATATITLAETFIIPDTPAGARVIAEVTDATLDGDRVKARRKGTASADWMALSPQGVGSLDVRMLFETDDGALIYTYYHGRMDLSGGIGASPTYCAPLYETGDERYRWLNTVQAVAKGTLDGQTLVYEIAEVR